MGPVELLHMSVYSQSFSPCGRFLAAGNNYGEISVFSLSAALSPDASEASQKPILTFTAHDGPVFSLLSTDSHLLSAGNGEISAWSWVELIKRNTKAVWTRRPNYKLGYIHGQNLKFSLLFVGGGDNNIHMMDLETGVFKSTLQGHSDYIHCLAVREREGELLSGAEDGAVRIWDSRTGRSVHCVEIYKYEECSRPQFGKWIGCLATDSDWMLCGGGPSLSLWHLRSLSPTSVFPILGCQRQAAFYQDLVITPLKADTQSKTLQLLSLQTCSSNIKSYSMINKTHVLTLGGSSDQIDVFTNLSYRAFSLSF
uniref:THO complex subunit 6 n=1 Tax=Denticeps clupeoides TaxID=299321 RepID=A0AAY4CJE7_9TELE